MPNPTICPTVTAENAHTYRAQMERIAAFTARVHIDIMDGIFVHATSVQLDQVWWPGGVRADIHAMMKDPFAHTDLFRALAPQLVIVHAEADGDFVRFAEAMHNHGIETGIALLQQTPVEAIAAAIDLIDHVLVFSGNLGHFGGAADPGLLDKVHQLRQLKPTLEIGWDGGINDQNARMLAMGGVDVLNVGGFIQRADDPEAAYERLREAVSGSGKL